MLDGGVEDAVGGNHDAEVDHLVVVTLEHDADDVLADIVHVALDGGHQDFAGALALLALDLGLHEGEQVSHGLLHYPRRFHHLGQEHFARTEQVAHPAHPGHQRPFDDVQRARQGGAGLFGIGDDVFGDAVDEGVGEAFVHVRLAPFQIDDARPDLCHLCTWARCPRGARWRPCPTWWDGSG